MHSDGFSIAALNFAIDYERALMQLSDTDLWVWLMYRRGYTQEWIGERLGVSQSDVAYHLGQIVSELGGRLHDDPVH